MKQSSLGILLLCLSTPAFGMKVFDMKEIRDPSTLQIKVLQDWLRYKVPSQPDRNWSAST